MPDEGFVTFNLQNAKTYAGHVVAVLKTSLADNAAGVGGEREHQFQQTRGRPKVFWPKVLYRPTVLNALTARVSCVRTCAVRGYSFLNTRAFNYRCCCRRRRRARDDISTCCYYIMSGRQRCDGTRKQT